MSNIYFKISFMLLLLGCALTLTTRERGVKRENEQKSDLFTHEEK